MLAFSLNADKKIFQRRLPGVGAETVFSTPGRK